MGQPRRRRRRPQSRSMPKRSALAVVVLALALCGSAALLGAQRGHEPSASAAFVEPAAPNAPAPIQPQAERIHVLFSPRGGCTDAIVEAIANADSSVDVQAYSFTSAPIARAVADAHAR